MAKKDFLKQKLNQSLKRLRRRILQKNILPEHIHRDR